MCDTRSNLEESVNNTSEPATPLQLSWSDLDHLPGGEQGGVPDEANDANVLTKIVTGRPFRTKARRLLGSESVLDPR